MPSSNIVVVEIGIPGPPGAGVSAAEKASFVTVSGANVFTNLQTIDRDGQAFRVRKADGTTNKLVFSTTQLTDGLWELRNSVDLKMSSDDGVTQTVLLDGGNGNAAFAGNVAANGGSVTGEQLWLAFMADGGGSALTTGIKFRWKIPYNCQIVTDGSAAWETVLDQTGSIGWDLWMDTYGNYPPTSADRISGTIGSQNPRISSAIKGQSATLTGWTTNLVKGRYLFISIDSASTATWAMLGLHVKKT